MTSTRASAAVRVTPRLFTIASAATATTATGFCQAGGAA